MEKNLVSNLPAYVYTHYLCYQVVVLGFLLGESQVTKLPGQLEGSEDGIVGREGDQGRRSQSAVLIDAGERMPQ